MPEATGPQARTPGPAAPADARHSHDLYEEETDDARTVRPYALTRGRTRSGRAHLPLEALVRRVPEYTDPAGTSERRRILELTTASILSIAELSAHLSLPLGVIRVLIGDLADEGLVVVHTGSPEAAPPATNLKVLESVLNGIHSL